MESFSEWLENELQIRNITPAELARKSGLSQSVVSRVINNERKPSPETLQKFARGLRISVQEIYNAAGMLPPVQDVKNALADRFAEVLAELPDEDVDEIYNLILFKIKRRKQGK